MQIKPHQIPHFARQRERLANCAFVASLYTLKWNWICASTDPKTGTYFSDRFKTN